jgi:Cu2+-exporting ATPase
VARLATRSLLPGMRVLTPAGERFAADGLVVAGVSEVDASLMTGETRPQRVAVGDRVYAGTVNLGQPVTMEVTAADEGSLIAEIARLMAVAEQGRASYVRLADRAAKLYAPAVHILGLLTFLGWLALGNGWEPALTAAIAVLIITCPCALALAVPAVQVAATSRLFAAGVLVKAPDALERLAEVDTIVLDKTGTLTRGEPQLRDATSLDADLLGRMAALAAASRHPYARAVVNAAQARGVPVVAAPDVTETAGQGLRRDTGADEERLGSAQWCGVDAAATGEAPLWYRCGDAPAVSLPLADPLRVDAGTVVAQLLKSGYGVALLSGDRTSEVERVAAELGIKNQAGGLLPADKLARLSDLSKDGRRVLMIGDGLNDAPSLAAAHASLSPSSAIAISQNAADAIVQGGALGPVVETLAVAQAARRMALQNFALAIGYNVVFVPLAVVGLVTPLIAAVAMSASSIAVTVNAVRLKSMRLTLERRSRTP